LPVLVQASAPVSVEQTLARGGPPAVLSANAGVPFS
jgi:hypothetical protein